MSSAVGSSAPLLKEIERIGYGRSEPLPYIRFHLLRVQPTYHQTFRYVGERRTLHKVSSASRSDGIETNVKARRTRASAQNDNDKVLSETEFHGAILRTSVTPTQKGSLSGASFL